jgi:hypothetical protein
VHRFEADEWVWDDEHRTLRFFREGRSVAEAVLTGHALDLWLRTLADAAKLERIVAEARARTEPAELQKID